MEGLTTEDIEALRGAWGVIAKSESRNDYLEIHDLLSFCNETAPSRVLKCGHGATLYAKDEAFVRAETQIRGNDPRWRTAMHLLQAGDRLELHWVGAICNREMIERGIAIDELEIRVYRPSGHSQEPLTFVVRWQGFAVDGGQSGRMIVTSESPDPASIEAP